VTSVSPPHTAPPFQRASFSAPGQEGDIDSRIKDLLKQLREERVERAADNAKLRRDSASHQKDLGKLQEDMSAIRETLLADGPMATAAKRLGQQPSGGTGAESGTWSLDLSGATIPEGKTTDVCGSIQEVVAVIEASQGTLKEDLQREIQALRYAFEGEQSRLNTHVQTMTERLDECKKISFMETQMSLPHQQQLPQLLERLSNLERNIGDVTHSSSEPGDRMMLLTRVELVEQQSATKFNALTSRLEQVEMRLPNGSNMICNTAELMDKVEKLEDHCVRTCIQELDNKLHSELRSCMQALSGDLRGEILGDFAVRVASAEARTGAVEARLGDDIQRVSAEIRMRVNKLESAQLVQRIQSLEEEARRFERKAFSNAVNDIDHSLRMTFSEEKDTGDCSRPNISLRPKAVEDKLEKSHEADLEEAPTQSHNRAPSVSKPGGPGCTTAAPVQQQGLSAMVMAHKGQDARSDSRGSSWQARLSSSSLEARPNQVQAGSQMRTSSGGSSRASCVGSEGPVIHALPSKEGGGQPVNPTPGPRTLSGSAQDRGKARGTSPTLSASSTASTFGGGSERMSQDANGQPQIAQRVRCLASPLNGSRAVNPLARNSGSSSSARAGITLGSRGSGVGMTGGSSLTSRHGASGSPSLNSKEGGLARDGMRVRFATQPVDSDASSSRHLDSGPAYQYIAEQEDRGYYTLAQLTDFRIWRKLPNVIPTERETYLAPRVFKELFSMAKEDFADLPRWKRDSLKRRHGLF